MDLASLVFGIYAGGVIGLAWIFYLSDFSEPIDLLLILLWPLVVPFTVVREIFFPQEEVTDDRL